MLRFYILFSIMAARGRVVVEVFFFDESIMCKILECQLHDVSWRIIKVTSLQNKNWTCFKMTKI